MAGSVPLVGPLFKQELPSFVRHSKQERARRRIRYALLHLPQLNLKHFLKFVALQWVKHHHCVQSVHELGRKLPPRRFHSRPLHLRVQPSCRLVLRLDKSHSSLHQLADFSSAKVGRQRSEEHTSELQSLAYLVCRLLLEKKKQEAVQNQNETQQQDENAQ